MQRKIAAILLLVLFGALLPCFAKTPSKCEYFNPAGTWFGGADFKYLMTITGSSGSMTVQMQAAYDNFSFGPVAWTGWSGTIRRSSTESGVYNLRAVSVYIFSKPPGADPYSPPSSDQMDMDILQGELEVVDCNTMKHTVNLYGAYLPLTDDVQPFVTPVNFDYMPASGVLVETYRRIPTP
jgi:hypothetical protein